MTAEQKLYNDRKFKFSVIMPVYNVENYLDEAVESIIKQSIGFKDNIEIILVDDGSTDSSPEICRKYQREYPSNVKFIQQKNQGPAAARDKGAAAAEGKYLSLPDSDDKLSKNTLKKVYDFFEKHYDEIDVVTIPWEYFEARTGRDHPLNGKFYADRVIDLSTNYSEMVGSVAPSFFKAEVFKKHKSDHTVGKYSEDLRFMGEVLLDKQKYGVIRDAVYYYRKRYSQTSSQDGNIMDPFWYLKTPKTAIRSLLEYAKKQHNSVPKFIQFMVMYDLQWRIKLYGGDVLSIDEIKEYQSLLADLVKQIDDDVITAVGNIRPEHKIFALDLKYDSAKRRVSQSGQTLKYNDLVIESTYEDGAKIHIDFIEQVDNTVRIEANYLGLAESVEVVARVGDKVYKPEDVERKPKRVKMFVDRTVEFPSKGYVFTVPIKDLVGKKLRFYSDILEDALMVETGRHSGLSQKNKHSYSIRPNFILLKKRNAIGFARRSVALRVLLELRYLAVLLFRINMQIMPYPVRLRWYMLPEDQDVSRLRRLTYGTLHVISLPLMFMNSIITTGFKNALLLYAVPVAHQARANIYSTLFRILYYATKPYYARKNLWMFMDRTFEGDDSAEILFEYTIAQNNPDITPYFTIKEDSQDFNRISKIGWTVPFLSQHQKLLFLHSKKVISSHADDVMTNPFLGLVADVNDLYHFDFIFLQHGIIKDDISDWLNRYNKNIKLFVTSVRGEYQSLLDYQYFYDESVVKLTGLPRYDKLDNKPENKIALTPTWRNHLAITVDDADRGHSEEFKNTYYYKYYQAFISDDRLNKALEKYDYTMQFYIHPSFKSQYVDFKPGKFVEVKRLPYDYKKVKSVSKLMVTDFSSVVFDFAYLRKPIIYGQFDEDTYWEMHMSNPGYFSYRKDGLGPVTTDLETTVDKIIEYLENDCRLEKKYADRIEKFFAFNDKNNAKRVYDEILKQDAKETERS